MVFLDAPGANFDLSSLSFHVPMRGLAAKVAAVAVNNSASATSRVRFFLIARFRALSPRDVKSKQEEKSEGKSGCFLISDLLVLPSSPFALLSTLNKRK